MHKEILERRTGELVTISEKLFSGTLVWLKARR